MIQLCLTSGFDYRFFFVVFVFVALLFLKLDARRELNKERYEIANTGGSLSKSTASIESSRSDVTGIFVVTVQLVYTSLF